MSKTMGRAFVATVIAVAVVACRVDAPPAANLPPSPATVTVNGVPSDATAATAQAREDEFRWKERCASAAERLDKLFASTGRGSKADISISEVFYSPSRNSCMCEVSAIGNTGKGGGAQNLLTLYDCLTREEVGMTVLDLNGAWQPVHEAWTRGKEKWKAAAAAPANPPTIPPGVTITRSPPAKPPS